MKVWELENDKEYESDIPQHEKIVFKVIDGDLWRRNEGIYYRDYMTYNHVRKCDFTEYTPPTDWSKVKVDAKIFVSNSKDRFWRKRHFAKFEDGKVYVWRDGETSWSSDDDENITAWSYYKLATEESEE